MEGNPMQPKTLLEAIRLFSEEQVCIDTIASLRWHDGKPTCPKCGNKTNYWLGTQKRWKCKKCSRQFSVKQGTIFEDSPLPLDKWLTALWLIVNCKNGISSHEVAKDLGVTQKSAWFMLHRLRLALRARSLDKIGSPDGGGVEADEAFFGGNPQKMHKDRRLRVTVSRLQTPKELRRSPWPNKTAVMGLYDRESRQVRAKVVPNVKRETLQSEILNNVHFGSQLYTDQAVAYSNLQANYIHQTVTHIDNYVRGEVHTNCLENFWSLTKRTLRGTYVAVEPFHLDRYMDEQVFRFNNRKTKDNQLDDADRFLIALSQVANKRLTYADLTGKAGGGQTT
jgi:transposase-like protein